MLLFPQAEPSVTMSQLPPAVYKNMFVLYMSDASLPS
jgi:hypothetical protein